MILSFARLANRGTHLNYRVVLPEFLLVTKSEIEES